jgi:hypothetical protein
VERYVASDDQFVVALVVRKRGQVERPWCEQLCVRGSNPAGSIGEVFAIGILSKGDEQVGNGPAGARKVDPAAAWKEPEPRREVSNVGDRHQASPWQVGLTSAL